MGPSTSATTHTVTISTRARGKTVLEQKELKNAKKQLQKAIESRDANELREALLVCNSLDGFNEPKANKVLLQRAEQMKEKAFVQEDTSTMTQKQREQYVNYELRTAGDKRDIKMLNSAIKNADLLQKVCPLSVGSICSSRCSHCSQFV